MRQGVRWTNLSRRNISRQLEKTGTPANKYTVSKLLYDQEFRRRKPQKKRTIKQHKYRNAQFENISRLKKEYLDAGKPVLSMDTNLGCCVEIGSAWGKSLVRNRQEMSVCDDETLLFHKMMNFIS